MRKSSVGSTRAALPRIVDRNLKLYSAAAIAAGVSFVALMQPAQGEVVVTRKTIQIPENSFPPVGLDFNHDGINDFTVNLNYSAYPDSDHALFVSPAQSGSGAVVASQNNYALALVRGARIGPSAHFASTNRAIEFVNSNDDTYTHFYSRFLYGNWGGNPSNRYLGVKFLIKGHTHYGWIRLTVITDPRGLFATITAYAYETVANKEITAGASAKPTGETSAEDQAQKPGRASLGMLAVGGDGLTLWRREQNEPPESRK